MRSYISVQMSGEKLCVLEQRDLQDILSKTSKGKRL